jgi:hypothetical protein
MATISIPMFIDFSRDINNLKEMIILQLTNLLQRYNLDRLDLIPYDVTKYGFALPRYFYYTHIELPSFDYCNCGDYETAHMVAIVKKGNKWIAYWDDESCDYESISEESCKRMTDFSLNNLSDYVMLYNRVYAILTNPNLFNEEREEADREYLARQERLAK